jgi:hypothetical protein
MSLLQILTDPQNFRFYAGGRGHVSNAGSFGQTSIPYGDDTKGGGSSNQPYIKSPIPDALTANPSDYILRGGLLTNTETSAQDVSRLTKMFTDTKSTNGLFFTLKQEQLSATAVRTQASPSFGLNGQLYSPLNTLAQAGVISLGTHLNKQGINPFAETGAYANGNERLYGVVVTKDQLAEDNRLYQLMNGKLVGNNAQGPDPAYVMRYAGGPGSVLGVGRTVIRFGKDSKTPLTLAPGSFNFTSNIESIGQNDWTFSANLIKSVTTNTSGIEPGEIVPPITNKSQIQSPKLQDFRKILRANLQGKNQQTATNSGATPDAPVYSGPDAKNYEQNFNFTDPGQRSGKSYANYSRGVLLTNGSGNPTTLAGAVDKINALPIYKSDTMNISDATNDFVKFVIAPIDNNNPAFSTFMHFRALLDSFNDSYNASWNSTKYLGRGENFYTYDSFTRTVALSFTVAAQSKQELIPMYKKLNYLASQLTPDYSPSGYMRGPLVKLTVGGYLYEQPGFIQDLSYDLITDAPWEIAINETGEVDPTVKQLSQMVKVTSFTFVPIHTFTPQKQGLGFDNLGFNNTQGDQRYIALEDGSTTNYDRISTTNLPPKNLSPINVTPPKPGTVRRTQAFPPSPDYTLPVQRTDFL